MSQIINLPKNKKRQPNVGVIVQARMTSKRFPGKSMALLANKPVIEHVGSLYITKNYEIGIFIFKRFQGRGYASDALYKVITDPRYGNKFLANINPLNEKSKQFFKKFGFECVQHTYVLERV